MFIRQLLLIIPLDSSRAVAKALVEMGKGADKEGFDAFKASVDGATVCEEAKAVAELYANAKTAMTYSSRT